MGWEWGGGDRERWVLSHLFRTGIAILISKFFKCLNCAVPNVHMIRVVKRHKIILSCIVILKIPLRNIEHTSYNTFAGLMFYKWGQYSRHILVKGMEFNLEVHQENVINTFVKVIIHEGECRAMSLSMGPPL